MHSGKSTTIREICKRLDPLQVLKLIIDKNNFNTPTLEIGIIENIYNDTLIIEVNGKLILVLAGCPTEQGISLTVILNQCNILKLTISFIIVAKRKVERKTGFNTQNELASISTIKHIENIEFIDFENYMNTPIWENRIDNIIRIINLDLNN